MISFVSFWEGLGVGGMLTGHRGVNELRGSVDWSILLDMYEYFAMFHYKVISVHSSYRPGLNERTYYC